MAVTLVPVIQNPLLPDDAKHTTANLKYYSPPENGEKPYDRLYQSDLPKLNFTPMLKHKKIYDLRPLVDAGRANETNTDVTGFQVLTENVARTEMTEQEWDDEDTITSKYYQEVDALLKKVTGATRVFIFDHTIRKVELPGHETPDTPQSRKPVARVHIDQTPESGRKRVIRHLGADAERLLRGRAQLINVWRPLRGIVQDQPLAVADARTLKESHLVRSDLLYNNQPNGETYQVSYSDDHRFYYLSNMTPHEALLLKCWSNEEDGGAKTPHTGFVDDFYVGKEVETPRQSIEIRALVFHEPQEE
ncbi:hypothetical protein T439DRAFT_325444 [Meredithblackwellia eburnea MCA 4105]